MPPAVAAAAISGAAGIGGALISKSGKKTSTQTTTPNYVDWFGDPYGATGKSNLVFNKNPLSDPSLPGYKHGNGAFQILPGSDAPSRLDTLRESLLDQLNSQIANFNDPGAYPDINISTPHVGAASHMSAAHAHASLINMLDQAFQAEPNANLREDVYSRAKSGAASGAEDSIRRLMDSARASGAGPNAPWVQQLSMEAREKAGQQSTQALTDFFDSYVTAALGRRAAALGQNSETQTKVNMFNAGADNEASAFNAGADNSVKALQAQLAGLTDRTRAELGFNLASLKDQRQGNIMDILYKLTQPIQNGSTTTQSASGGNNWLGAVSGLAHDILSQIPKGGGGGGGVGGGGGLGYSDGGFAFNLP